MKILVTGSAGFIGYHLSKSLLKEGNDVLGIDNLNNYYSPELKKSRVKMLKNYDNFKFCKGDICDKKLMNRVINSFSPQKVLHMAAQPGVQYSLKNPYAYSESNLSGFINIIEICRKIKVDGFIYASSSSVYGNSKKIPFDINDRADSPLSLYGATKRANELIAYSYSNLYGLKTTGLRFFTVYGDWYRPDMAIFIFTKNILENRNITVYNKGLIRRDFTYIDDIVKGSLSAMKKNYNCEIFNLGNNKNVTLKSIIDVIEKNVGNKATIEYDQLPEGDALETYANIKLSKEKLDFQPKTNIELGIPKFIEWYRSYYDI